MGVREDVLEEEVGLAAVLQGKGWSQHHTSIPLTFS